MKMMIIALMAGKTLLPNIDVESLELQARAEALQGPVIRASSRLALRPASSSRTLGLGSITTICRAAGGQADPAAFVTRLSRAYSLPDEEIESLRSSCAAYLAGSADARRRSAH